MSVVLPFDRKAVKQLENLNVSDITLSNDLADAKAELRFWQQVLTSLRTMTAHDYSDIYGIHDFVRYSHVESRIKNRIAIAYNNVKQLPPCAA